MINNNTFKYDNFYPNQYLGQNFLIDKTCLLTIAKIVSSFYKSNIITVEYGAGLGWLTKNLLNQKMNVYAIEKDKYLINYLISNFNSYIEHNQLIIDKKDIRNIDILTFFSQYEKIILCGNLPYYVSNFILNNIINIFFRFSGVVLLLQKEFVNRIIAKPNSKYYCRLSVLLQTVFYVRKIYNISRFSFWPIPKVHSTLIVLYPISIEKFNRLGINWNLFKTIVSLVFLNRRRKIINILNHISNIDQIMKVLRLSSELRAEHLSVNNFVNIIRMIC